MDWQWSQQGPLSFISVCYDKIGLYADLLTKL